MIDRCLVLIQARETSNSLTNRECVSGDSMMLTLAQAASGGAGLPYINYLLLVAGIGGALFAVCRSANRR